MTHQDAAEDAPEPPPLTDREWLDAHAGELINFLAIAQPASTGYPDIKEMRETLATLPDDQVTEIRDALELWIAASAQLPGWLVSGLTKMARAYVRIQDVKFP